MPVKEILLNFLRLMRKLFKASVSRRHLSVMMGSASIDAYLELKMRKQNEKCVKLFFGFFLHFNQIQQLENEHLPKYSQIKLRNNDFSC